MIIKCIHIFNIHSHSSFYSQMDWIHQMCWYIQAGIFYIIYYHFSSTYLPLITCCDAAKGDWMQPLTQHMFRYVDGRAWLFVCWLRFKYMYLQYLFKKLRHLARAPISTIRKEWCTKCDTEAPVVWCLEDWMNVWLVLSVHLVERLKKHLMKMTFSHG